MRSTKWRANLRPGSRLTVSDWADKYQMLPSSSAEPGRYKTSRVPYMREIMDSFTQSDVHRIVVKSAAQVGKSAVLLNIVGRSVHLEPANIMIIEPTLEIAEDFSKERLASMIADVKELTGLFYDKVRSRDSNQTILSKFFKGGRVILAGANSPASLASRPIKILLCDEVDRYPVSAGKEGDPIEIAAKRTTTYFDYKIALFSTPTVEGRSRIDVEYYLGTQEEWSHKCPNCGEYRALRYEDMIVDYEEEKDIAGGQMILVNSVKWRCSDCGFKFSEREMKKSAQKYVMRNKSARKNGRRSFWVSGFSSAWLDWREIMREWLEARGNPERESVVMNTRFGLSYRYEVREVEDSELEGRLERYGAQVPDGVLAITMGVDVQNNRLHYNVIGWGVDYECWHIECGVIYGKPTEASVWQELDSAIDKTYLFRSGEGIKIARVFIDSGFLTDIVYKYCRGKLNVFPIKGLGTVSVPLIHKITIQEGLRLVILGVNAGKAQVFSRLERMHFGSDDVMKRNYDRKFFKELTSEQRVLKRHGGSLMEVYEKKHKDSRNEALDCTVYALAAIESLVGRDEKKFWLECAAAKRGEEKKAVKKMIKHKAIDIW